LAFGSFLFLPDIVPVLGIRLRDYRSGLPEVLFDQTGMFHSSGLAAGEIVRFAEILFKVVKFEAVRLIVVIAVAANESCRSGLLQADHSLSQIDLINTNLYTKGAFLQHAE
jgi:hypothetical protein